MADEESEIRRMAEIADAINAILDADPVGDTPAQGSPMARDETVNSENTITETVAAPDGKPDDRLAANDAIAPDAAAIGGNGDHNVADDLDAAIAAEFERDGDHAAARGRRARAHRAQRLEGRRREVAIATTIHQHGALARQSLLRPIVEQFVDHTQAADDGLHVLRRARWRRGKSIACAYAQRQTDLPLHRRRGRRRALLPLAHASRRARRQRGGLG